MAKPPIQLVLLGPPGAGKGTQADILVRKVAVPHISTGDMLRAEARRGSEVGLAARKLMERGEFVPDELMLDIVKARLEAPDCANGFLLDGFPRSRSQAEALEGILAGEASGVTAASLEVPFDEVVKRLSGRRTCRSCGAMYHVELGPSKEAGVCDRCGGQLYQRDDDHEDVIEARLELYRRETEPVLDFYEERGQLVRVDGSGATADVTGRLIAALEGVA